MATCCDPGVTLVRDDQKENTDEPLVTIAIPTYNRRDYLQEAISSALRQNWSRLDVVVSDNNSNDDTREYLKSIVDSRVSVILQKTNIGMFGNWNACLEAAKGDYFLLLSDDDLLEQGAIQALVSATKLKEASPVDFAWCKSRIINSFGEIQRLSFSGSGVENDFQLISAFFNGKRELFPCTILFSTSMLRKLGGYTAEKFNLSADAHLWMRALLEGNGRAICVSNALVSYRIHRNATSKANADLWQSEYRRLQTYAVRKLHMDGRHVEAGKIQKVSSFSLARLRSGEILNYHDNTANTRQGLTLLWIYRSDFKSMRGTLLWFVSLLKVILPKSILRAARNYRKNIAKKSANHGVKCSYKVGTRSEHFSEHSHIDD